MECGSFAVNTSPVCGQNMNLLLVVNPTKNLVITNFTGNELCSADRANLNVTSRDSFFSIFHHLEKFIEQHQIHYYSEKPILKTLYAAPNSLFT